MIVRLLPEEPEASGLMALMLFLQSRCNARRSKDGKFVPLSEQAPELWDAGQMDDAERLLRQASLSKVIGRYQLEAAIQSVHASRRFTGETNWKAILDIYIALVKIAPSPVVSINLAVALAEIEGAAIGLSQMPDLKDYPELAQYQPYHAARAALLARDGKHKEAHLSYELAIGLESDAAIRAFLIDKQATMR